MRADVLCRQRVDDVTFRQQLAGEGVIVAGSLAQLAGKAFRIGHMGNTTPAMLEAAIEKIGEVLLRNGLNVDIEKAKETWQSYVSTFV